MADQEEKSEEPQVTVFGKAKAAATQVGEIGTKATHATDTIFNMLSWKLAAYLKSDQTKGKAPTKSSVAVGGAFAFSYGNHVDTVTIASSAVLDSGNSTYLQAIIDEGPQRTVFRYRRPNARRARGTPVLLVPPLAAPASCFDLRRGCSMAEHLLLFMDGIEIGYGRLATAPRLPGHLLAE